MALASRLRVFGLLASISGGSAIIVYNDWRESEIAKIRSMAIELLRNGTIMLESPISPQQKKDAWQSSLRPKMIAHWKKEFPGFEYANQETWPQPENGKEYRMTSTFNQVPNLPLLTSGNYQVQGIVAYMMDPKLQRVHFGDSTHIKLQLIANPLYVLFGGISNYRKVSKFLWPNPDSDECDCCELEGSDQSWHIVNVDLDSRHQIDWCEQLRLEQVCTAPSKLEPFHFYKNWRADY